MKNGCLELHVNLRHSNLLCVLAIGLMGSAAASATPDYVTAPSNLLFTPEDTVVPLELALEHGLLNGGSSPDLIATATGFRATAAGATPVIATIPANTTSIAINAYSTEPNDTPENNIYNDEYQLLNVQV